MERQFTIIYFTTDQNDDITHFQTQLQGLIECNISFNEMNECVDFITDKPDGKFILVTTNYDTSQTMISVLNGLAQLAYVYLYSGNDQMKKTVEVHKEWRKIRFIGHTFNELYKKLSYDLIRYERQKYSIPFNIGKANDESTSANASSFSSPLRTFNRQESSTSDLGTENGNFIWFQLFIETLLRMEYDTTMLKKELIQYCTDIYKNDKIELKKLVEFESTYSSNDAVKWYTRDMCLYRLLNKALRVRDVETVVNFGFFITDIFKKLSDATLFENDECQFKVSRGQIISKNEFNRIEKSIGGLLSFNSFVSASKDQDIGLIYAGSSSDDLICVVFDINIDRNIKGTKPFADISRMSYIPDEQEVLFMLGSVFRIVSVDCGASDKPAMISLDICSENDQLYKDVLEAEKLKLEEHTTLFQLAELLYRIGDYNLSVTYYKKHMQEHPEDTTLCEINLVNMSYLMNQSKFDSEKMMVLSNKLMKMTSDLGIDKEAVEHGLERKHQGFSHEQRALMYATQEKYDLARLEQEQALEEQLKCLPSDHPIIAKSLFNIGCFNYKLQNFEQALDYIQKSLVIREKSLPATHPDLMATYGILGTFYHERNNYQLALDFYTKAIKIYHISNASNPGLLLIWEMAVKDIKDCLLDKSIYNQAEL